MDPALRKFRGEKKKTENQPFFEGENPQDIG